MTNHIIYGYLELRCMNIIDVNDLALILFVKYLTHFLLTKFI